MKSLPWCALLVVTLSAAAGAQEAPEPEKPRAARAERAPGPLIPLKVRIVLIRQAGDQRVASLPYVLSVTAGDRDSARLRMGVEVPVVTAVTEGAPKAVQYRNVGVNIDCRADPLPDGRYRLSITAEQSSIYVAEGDSRGGAAAPLAAQPMFRTFMMSLDPVLRDGETQQFTVATDPVTGEQTRAEVTLTVMK